MIVSVSWKIPNRIALHRTVHSETYVLCAAQFCCVLYVVLCMRFDSLVPSNNNCCSIAFSMPNNICSWQNSKTTYVSYVVNCEWQRQKLKSIHIVYDARVSVRACAIVVSFWFNHSDDVDADWLFVSRQSTSIQLIRYWHLRQFSSTILINKTSHHDCLLVKSTVAVCTEQQSIH